MDASGEAVATLNGSVDKFEGDYSAPDLSIEEAADRIKADAETVASVTSDRKIDSMTVPAATEFITGAYAEKTKFGAFLEKLRSLPPDEKKEWRDELAKKLQAHRKDAQGNPAKRFILAAIAQIREACKVSENGGVKQPEKASEAEEVVVRNEVKQEPEIQKNEIRKHEEPQPQAPVQSKGQGEFNPAQLAFDEASPQDPVAIKKLVDDAMNDGELQRLFADYDAIAPEADDPLACEDVDVKESQNPSNDGIFLDVNDDRLRTELPANAPDDKQTQFRFAFAMTCQNVQFKVLDRVKQIMLDDNVGADEALKKLELRDAGSEPSAEQVQIFGKYLDEHVIGKSGDYKKKYKEKLVALFKALPSSVTDVMTSGTVSDCIYDKKRHLAGAAIVDMVVHMAKELGLVGACGGDAWVMRVGTLATQYKSMVENTAEECAQTEFYFGNNREGVCEAGCALWLAAMQKGGDLTEAKSLNQYDSRCRDLQNEVDKGLSLQANDKSLKDHAHARRAAFAPMTLHGPHDAMAAFRTLAPGKMVFLASSTGIFHHAMAVYAAPDEAGQLYLFNPGGGVWKGTANQIAVILQQQMDVGVDGDKLTAISAQFLEPSS